MKSATEFLNTLRNTPQTEFLIDQLLPDADTEFMIICGRPEIGKTNLALYASFCLATGQPFFSFKTKQVEVGYLFMEGGKRQIGQRIEKLSKHFGGIPSNLHIDHEVPIPLDPKGKIKLASLVSGLRVCFVDAIKYLIPGDYMKPADVLKGLNALQEVQQQTGVIFVLIGHIRKPNLKGSIRREDYWTELKGPTEYLEMANSALMLTRPKQAQDSRGHFLAANLNARQLEFIKAKDAPRELNPLYLIFNRDDLLFRQEDHWHEDTEEGRSFY